jgi:hypothetical protein
MRQADGLAAQTCSFALRLRVGVALVEHEIDHRCHHVEALRALVGIGRFEGHVRLRDARFGARDALLHRAIFHQESPRDLVHGEP